MTILLLIYILLLVYAFDLFYLIIFDDIVGNNIKVTSMHVLLQQHFWQNFLNFKNNIYRKTSIDKLSQSLSNLFPTMSCAEKNQSECM